MMENLRNACPHCKSLDLYKRIRTRDYRCLGCSTVFKVPNRTTATRKIFRTEADHPVYKDEQGNIIGRKVCSLCGSVNIYKRVKLGGWKCRKCWEVFETPNELDVVKSMEEMKANAKANAAEYGREYRRTHKELVRNACKRWEDANKSRRL